MKIKGLTLYLVRHGESELNKKNTHQFASTPLSELGLKQAMRTAKILKKLKQTPIYSSPFIRAIQTAEQISHAMNIPYALKADLHEIKRPTLFEGKHHDDPSIAEAKKEILAHAEDTSWHHSDEENITDVRDRIAHVMSWSEQQEPGNVILVTHGMVIRMWLGLILFGDQMTRAQFMTIHTHIKIDNASVTILRYNPETSWKIIMVNGASSL